MAEIKVTKIDAQGEQTTYIYDNAYTAVANLVNCVMQYHFNNSNWWSSWYKVKAQAIAGQIITSKHFYIWNDAQRNISFCTRIA